MSSVRALAYMGVRGPDLDDWSSFATEILGMQVAIETETSLTLRMDERAHRLTVEKGGPGLAFLGFELATRPDLDELLGHMRAEGIDVTDDPELAVQRQVRHLARCVDPAGNPIELVVGLATATSKFVSPRGVTFKTGAQGLGHAVIIVPDFDAAWRFYVDLLGLRLSDTIDLAFGTVTFLHCNPRHHSLALGAIPAMSFIGHFMVEVDDLEYVGRAYDLVIDRQIPVSMSLGMHTNDHMLSFYVKTPSGFDIEYGCNGREIDDATWTVGHYEAASLWGHRRASSKPA